MSKKKKEVVNEFGHDEDLESAPITEPDNNISGVLESVLSIMGGQIMRDDDSGYVSKQGLGEQPVWRTGPEPVPAGMYQMYLKYVGKKDKKVWDFENKKMTDQLEPGLEFIFHNPRVKRDFSNVYKVSFHERASLTKVLRGMGCPNGTLISKDGPGVWKFLQEQVGKPFMIELTVSKSGDFNNIGTISRLLQE